jgi:hypothetical protein
MGFGQNDIATDTMEEYSNVIAFLRYSFRTVSHVDLYHCPLISPYVDLVWHKTTDTKL